MSDSKNSNEPHEQPILRAPTSGNPKACGAKTRRGTQCMRPAMLNGRCNLHGGKTPIGIASPNFKHGRYSKHLPAGLLNRVREAEADPELLSAKGEISLVTARIAELAQRLHGGEAGSMWRELQEAVRSFDTAYAAHDNAGVNTSLNNIRRLVTHGAQDEERWHELIEACKVRTDLASKEWKRQVDLKQMLTAERASVFAMTILDAVLEHVPEPDRRIKIGMSLQRILMHREKAADTEKVPETRALSLPPQPGLPPDIGTDLGASVQLEGYGNDTGE